MSEKRVRRVGKLPPGAICEFRNCDRPQESRGYCSGHASQDRAGVELHEFKAVSNAGKKCRFDPCDRDVKARGLCAMHRRQELQGRPLSMPKPRGDGFINDDGYRVLCRPGHPNAYGARGIILEHRYVMSEHLGRALLPGENVHHKNGKRDDNRIENLELWVSFQPAGQRVEDLLEWADVVIARYGDLR